MTSERDDLLWVDPLGCGRGGRRVLTLPQPASDRLWWHADARRLYTGHLAAVDGVARPLPDGQGPAPGL